MKQILNLIHLISASILIFLILLQGKGVGFGNFLAGQSNYSSTRRGVERLIFILTVFFSVAFVISSVIQILVF